MIDSSGWLAVAMFIWFICLTGGTVLLVVNYCFHSMKEKVQPRETMIGRVGRRREHLLGRSA